MKARDLRPSLYISVVLAMVFCACSSSAWATSTVGPNFTISGTSVTLVAGATAGNVSAITVTPADGFTGSVALTAALASSPANAVASPALSFGSTTPVNITGTGTGTGTETAALTIATQAGGPLPCTGTDNVSPTAPWYAAGGTTLACILLFSIPARRRGWRKILGMFFLLAALTGGTLACGGGQMTHACPALAIAGTTPGAYTITVTGTSGTITSTGTVNLTVTAPATQ